MKHKTIAVIGLGQFGGTVSKMLASMDHEVLLSVIRFSYHYDKKRLFHRLSESC